MKYTLIILLSVLTLLSAKATDLRKVKELNGIWKFNVGDNIAWAQKDYDDSDWDRMNVPGVWEDDGYVGYNGFAWYRKNFTIKNTGNHKNLYLIITSIDDVDEAFLNGKKIGDLGTLPPNFETAWSYTRTYVIPSDMLESTNVLAIRVYDRYKNGGINGKVEICIDEDESLLDVNLSGMWKFKTGHDKERKYSKYNDSGWDDIYVPQWWEVQGYENYDGYAWYRKRFTMPADLANEDLILVLGKIDDTDMVYFNGQLIGTSIKKSTKYNWEKDNSTWAKKRAYKIPKDIITKENFIAVAVYDVGHHGGIYQGPIGIMTEKNYYQSGMYKNKGNDGNFWEYFFKELFD